jgi:U3 small nucleolar RNA-associated protein 22
LVPTSALTPYFVPAFKGDFIYYFSLRCSLLLVLVACLLESSGKWPDDLEAVRRLKAACYIQLSKALNGSGCIAKCTSDYVDVCKVLFLNDSPN